MPRKAQRLDEVHIAELRVALHKAIGNSSDQRFFYRLMCMLLMAEGFSPQRVADLLNEHGRTLERWRKRFLEQGVESLQAETSPGRPPRLSAEQMESVRRDMGAPPRLLGYPTDRWEGKWLQEHLERTHGVAISLRQCQRLLKRFRLERTGGRLADQPPAADDQVESAGSTSTTSPPRRRRDF